MTTENNIQDLLQDGYHTLLLGYAAGSLDYAQSLVVSTHISMNKAGRDYVGKYEELGGSLLENDCDPIDMSSGSLEKVLDLIDQNANETAIIKAAEKSAKAELFGDIMLPKVLAEQIEKSCEQARWSSLYPGLKTLELPVECEQSKARFLKADPALKTPHHSHGGTEITLVLDGSFTDETGSYKRGDMIVTDENCEHTPIASPEAGCLCMVVSTAPIKLTGMASILNPFIKI